eukprot:1925289-Amphidinium_carterae.1
MAFGTGLDNQIAFDLSNVMLCRTTFAAPKCEVMHSNKERIRPIVNFLQSQSWPDIVDALLGTSHAYAAAMPKVSCMCGHHSDAIAVYTSNKIDHLHQKVWVNNCSGIPLRDFLSKSYEEDPLNFVYDYVASKLPRRVFSEQ